LRMPQMEKAPEIAMTAGGAIKGRPQRMWV
jgi:hypothetical protein